MHKLVIEDDEGKAVVVPLIRDEITIGRQEGNTIRLTERNVSRRHARLMRRGADYVLEDLSSYIGTKVNGSRINAATPIKDGDQVVIGDYKLGIKIERPTASTMAYPAGPSAPISPVPGAPLPATAPIAATTTAPGVGPAANHAHHPGATVTGLGGVPGGIGAPAGVGATTLAGAAGPGAAAALAKAAAAPHGPTSAPPEPLEGAPTIPVRTLADQAMIPSSGMDAAAAAMPPARLVVMSQPLAGQEYYLDRASLVIGRTGENDIVLNHKSISRHHAKIIRDGDRYIVVDLESANGVRVNGAEYERIELQTGDVLELGHVRLRFVTGDDVVGRYDGDAFRLGGDARKPLMIGAAAAVVLAVVAAFALSGKDQAGKQVAVESPPAATTTQTPPATPPPAEPTPSGTPPGEAQAVAQAPAPGAAPGQPAAAPATPPTPSPATPAPAGGTSVPTPPAVPGETGAALLAKAKEAIKQEKWNEALTLLSQTAAAAPGSPEADQLRKVVETEKTSATQFEALERAVAGKDFSAIRSAYAGISDASIYKPRGRALHDEARAKLVAQHLGAAERRRLDGNCEAANREAEAVLAIDAQNRAARDVINRCARAAAAAPPAASPPVAAATPGPKTVNVGGSRPPAPARPAAAPPVAPRPAPRPAAAPPPVAAAARPPEDNTPPGAPDADELLQQAQDAWLKGQYAAAIEASRRALRAKPGLARAYQIIAVCSCSLRDSDSANKAYERLDETNKKMVKQLCQKSGVTID